MKPTTHKRKISVKRFLCLFLCAVMLLSFMPYGINLTSAHTAPLLYTNDSVFSSWQATPPQNVDGVIYIPVTMFIELENVYYFSNPKSGSFYLQNEITDEYLSFSADNPNNAYNGNAMLDISIKVFNSTIYLPAIKTANNLGLYIEMNTDNTVVRLSDASAKMSFKQLISLYEPTDEPPAEQTPPSDDKPPEDNPPSQTTPPESGTAPDDNPPLEDNPVTDPPVTDTPPDDNPPVQQDPELQNPVQQQPTTPPTPPEPEILPCDVYLCFVDPDSQTLDSLLVALENRNLAATFFFTREYIQQNPENVLHISTLGYSVALQTQNEYEDFDSLYADITSANTLLERITKQKTRLVRAASDKEPLKEQGYIPHSFDIQSKTAFSSKALAENIISQLNSHPIARVFMQTDITSVSALYEIGDYIAENDVINSYQIDETI